MADCRFPLKEKHWSKAEAVAHLISLRRKDGAFTVTAYRCPGSAPPHWHVGHTPKRSRRRRRHR